MSGVERSSPVFDDAATEFPCFVAVIFARLAARLLVGVLFLLDIFAVGQVDGQKSLRVVRQTDTPGSGLTWSRQVPLCDFTRAGLDSPDRQEKEKTMDDEARLVVEQQEDQLVDLKEVLMVSEGWKLHLDSTVDPCESPHRLWEGMPVRLNMNVKPGRGFL